MKYRHLQRLNMFTAHQRTAAILPLTVISLVALLGMVAFVIDLGCLALAKTEIQAAADAGALAGAVALGKNDPAAAKSLAQSAAQANSVAGKPVVVVPKDDIELGVWNSATSHFTKLSGVNELKASSVRITCRRTRSRDNPIPLYFAKVLGVSSGEVSATAIAARRVLCGTFIGIESASFNGSNAYSDSYNSSLGSYSSQTPGNMGHICSNGSISVQNGTVRGNAIPGPGKSVSIGPQGSVSGSKTPREQPLVLAPVNFGNVMTTNDNGRLPSPPYDSAKKEFKHNGGQLNLSAGTYYFTDLSISGGPVIVDGPVKIYVNGDVKLSGHSFTNSTSSPSNLKIFAAGKDVKITGSSDFSGIVYAPSSDIEVGGNAAFYGGAVGKSLRLHNNGGIHADEAIIGLFPSRSRLVD